MGAVLGICSASNLACCVGRAACSLCCRVRCCPAKSNASTVTRLVYAFILLIGSIVSWVMLSDWASNELAKVPALVDSFVRAHCLTDGGCSLHSMAGVMGVYRVFFVLALFFALLAVLTFRVRSSKDPRAGIQNGWWLPKTLFIVGLLVGSFFMPNSVFFDWGYLGLVGAFLFILVQLVLLVDFAHEWCDKWVAKWEETESKIYQVGLLGSTALLYALTIVLTVLLFVYFAAGSDCRLNKFFVGFNLALCIVLSVISVLPAVQQANPRSGLLQASVVSIYMTYLTWSAVSNEPDSACASGASSGVSSSTSIVLGAIFTFITVIYSSVRSATQVSASSDTDENEVALLDSDALITNNGRGHDDSDADDDGESGGHHETIDNEQKGCEYNYSMFNLIFCLASLYLMEVITNWASVNNGSEITIDIGHSWTAVWVKMASTWTAALIYLWTLVAPLVLTNRDFGLSSPTY